MSRQKWKGEMKEKKEEEDEEEEGKSEYALLQIYKNMVEIVLHQLIP